VEADLWRSDGLKGVREQRSWVVMHGKRIVRLDMTGSQVEGILDHGLRIDDHLASVFQSIIIIHNVGLAILECRVAVGRPVNGCSGSGILEASESCVAGTVTRFTSRRFA
jgi:hypothetical protein